MADWQERVIEERRLLEEKIEKLDIFLHSAEVSAVSKDEFERMTRQLEVMREYSAILSARIAWFR